MKAINPLSDLFHWNLLLIDRISHLYLLTLFSGCLRKCCNYTASDICKPCHFTRSVRVWAINKDTWYQETASCITQNSESEVPSSLHWTQFLPPSPVSAACPGARLCSWHWLLWQACTWSGILPITSLRSQNSGLSCRCQQPGWKPWQWLVTQGRQQMFLSLTVANLTSQLTAGTALLGPMVAELKGRNKGTNNFCFFWGLTSVGRPGKGWLPRALTNRGKRILSMCVAGAWLPKNTKFQRPTCHTLIYSFIHSKYVHQVCERGWNEPSQRTFCRSWIVKHNRELNRKGIAERGNSIHKSPENKRGLLNFIVSTE